MLTQMLVPGLSHNNHRWRHRPDRYRRPLRRRERRHRGWEHNKQRSANGRHRRHRRRRGRRASRHRRLPVAVVREAEEAGRGRKGSRLVAPGRRLARHHGDSEDRRDIRKPLRTRVNRPGRNRLGRVQQTTQPPHARRSAARPIRQGNLHGRPEHEPRELQFAAGQPRLFKTGAPGAKGLASHKSRSRRRLSLGRHSHSLISSLHLAEWVFGICISRYHGVYGLGHSKPDFFAIICYRVVRVGKRAEHYGQLGTESIITDVWNGELDRWIIAGWNSIALRLRGYVTTRYCSIDRYHRTFCWMGQIESNTPK